jgi:GNAT superfamily N-acetyltransferase
MADDTVDSGARTSAAAVTSRLLSDGLVLRPAGPADLDQIGDLLADRGEPADRVDHRLAVQDRDLGWAACAVVVDGQRVVSTALLLDETLRLADVVLPAGQVELVATHRDYEGRGLVRALMDWAHDRSAAQGHLLQAMIGIPYFYRRFGYEYAVDIPRARELAEPPTVVGREPSPILRRAEPRDIPALTALQDAAQRAADVAMPHPLARWRWLLQHEASTTWVLERDGAVAASARTGPPDGGVLVAEAAGVDVPAADDLLQALIREHGADLQIVDRPGTMTGAAWAARLGATATGAQQYYLRLPSPERVLDALRPVLHRRLVDAGMDRVGNDIVLSTFGRHYRMPVTPEGLGAVVAGGPMQAPGAVRGAGVAPDYLGALLFGSSGMDGLARIRPDVYPGPDAELFTTLFPPLTADLLTYYLPW